ncbi:hypothetical protein BC832DRAFT_591953 [Gaertneriomyces semiglobifer]|nr:hypothetical protein BC832DRAFT_591953 [Gaertneriomyces semiglobifer]
MPNNTRDSYQGSENPYIIISGVATESPGFLNEVTRAVVALMCAKKSLVVVGSINAYPQVRLWNELLKFCASKQRLFAWRDPRRPATLVKEMPDPRSTQRKLQFVWINKADEQYPRPCKYGRRDRFFLTKPWVGCGLRPNPAPTPAPTPAPARTTTGDLTFSELGAVP